MGATDSVRKALSTLGANASDQQVKAYIRENDPTVPQAQISLALRKLREKAIPREKSAPGTEPAHADPCQGTLFPEE